jgi:hypothetical protein
MAASVEQFEQVMAAFLGQDSAIRSQAEAAIEQTKANPDGFVVFAAQLLAGSQNVQVRSTVSRLLSQ